MAGLLFAAPHLLAATCDLQTKEAAAARKRQLLAELECAGMARIAAGDTRETYVLCPRTPEAQTPERLAA
jgi:hypothetical protein